MASINGERAVGASSLRHFVQDVLKPSSDGLHFRQVVEAIADSVVIHRDGHILYANPSAIATIGAGLVKDVIGQPVLNFVAPEDREAVNHAIGQVAETGRASAIVPYTGISLDGRRHDIETIAVLITADDGFPAFLNVCRDVTERNKTASALRDSEARFETLARLSPDAIIAVCGRRIVLANQAAAGLFGFASEEQLEGRDVDQFCPEGRCGIADLNIRTIDGGEVVPRQVHGRCRRLDGLLIDLELTSIPFTLRNEPAAYLIMRDVTARLRDEERHRYLASHDLLTGLPNRLEFQHRLRRLIEREERTPRRFAIHYLDLDFFKNVNDSLGHDVGDRLLQMVAVRLKRVIRATDLVARLGGDEFAVLQGEADHDDSPQNLADKLQRAIGQPYTVADHLLHTSTTIGIAVCPDHGEDPDQLLRRADLALYHAKESGRNVIRVFSDDLDTRIRERDSLVNQLVRAETCGEFELHFQPIVALSSGKVEAAEALLRWNHPERGLMSAETFVHAIEASREAHRIGVWVLREACRQARRWQDAGIDDVRVAVNLSMPMLQRPDFAEMVLNMLDNCDLAPERLELELTERMIISAGAAGIVPKLTRLREQGVHIALDDFGTGFSSLSLLKDLPVDRIKIDRSFIAGFGHSADDTAIVRAVTNLGVSMNKRVTAEGVDCPEVMDRLRNEGCHDIQGYHFARPMPSSALIDFLRQARG